MKKTYQYLIQFKRPDDDSWLFHVPNQRFENRTELKKHLIDNTETIGTIFKIVKKLKS